MESPPCALECAMSISGATNQTLFCLNQGLQLEVGACIQRECTIKEALMAQNVTATMCHWPQRDESSLVRDIAILLSFLATAAVAARMTSRLPAYNGPLGPDDYVMAFIWVLLIPFTGLLCTVTYNGLGKDVWTVAFDVITLNLKYTSILLYFYITFVWLTKISILFLYLRLFPDQKFRYVVKIGIMVCSTAGISFLVGSAMRCRPIDFTWTFWDGEHAGRCINILYSAQGWPHLATNVTADLCILLLPLPTLWKLNLAVEKKLSVMSMFSVGAFVTAINVYRATTFPALLASHNPTWDYTRVGLWSSIEVYTGVICACMPGVRAFITQVYPARRWTRAKHHLIQPNGSYTMRSTNSPGASGKRLNHDVYESEMSHTTVSAGSERIEEGDSTKYD